MAKGGRKLGLVAAFMEVYHSLIGDHSAQEAYEIAEQRYMAEHGQRFYKDWPTFRACKSSWMNRRRQGMTARAC